MKLNMNRVQIVPVESTFRQQLSASVLDLKQVFETRQLWTLGAIRGVGSRYRRTFLGPWWMTLSSIIFIFGLSYLRISLTGQDWKAAVPYVGVGFIGFGLIIGGMQSASGVFIGAGRAMVTGRQPYLSFIAGGNTAQLIEFGHDALVIFLMAFVFSFAITFMWLWSVVAVVLIVAASLGMGMWLGPLVARYRDVGPIVGVIIRMMFFLTPIFWSIDMIDTERVSIAKWNPFTYQLLAFRDPILGTHHGWIPMGVSAAWALGNLVVGFLVFTRVRAKLPYWVT